MKPAALPAMLQAHTALGGSQEGSTTGSSRAPLQPTVPTAAPPPPSPLSLRTYLEPGRSASPGPALSCGKICSWTQSHIVLEEKPWSSMRAAHTGSSLLVTPTCQAHRPPSLPSRHTHTHQGSPEQPWAGSGRSCWSSQGYFYLTRTHLFAETSDKASWFAPLAG